MFQQQLRDFIKRRAALSRGGLSEGDGDLVYDRIIVHALRARLNFRLFAFVVDILYFPCSDHAWYVCHHRLSNFGSAVGKCRPNGWLVRVDASVIRVSGRVSARRSSSLNAAAKYTPAYMHEIEESAAIDVRAADNAPFEERELRLIRMCLSQHSSARPALGSQSGRPESDSKSGRPVCPQCAVKACVRACVLIPVSLSPSNVFRITLLRGD